MSGVGRQQAATEGSREGKGTGRVSGRLAWLLFEGKVTEGVMEAERPSARLL
jgi:hypothetical protein